MNIQEKIQLWQKTLQSGGMLVVTDDESRENEGDLIASAQTITQTNVALMIRHTSGIICTPITQKLADQLEFPLMVVDNNAPFRTNFTISVDGVGTSTGISASDRLKTMRNMAQNNAKATDFVKPGHIFPLIARHNGVLARTGHTEAAIDLCLLANLPPVGVLCELMNDDGSVMKGEQITQFAKMGQYPQLTIAELAEIRNILTPNLWSNL